MASSTSGLGTRTSLPFIPRNSCSQWTLAPNHFSPPLPQYGAFPSFLLSMTSDVEKTHLASPVSPLQVPLCHGHGEILAPGEAALLLPPPPRVQPPLPLQMQRLRLQPLHTGEHCSPPEPEAKGGLVQLTAALGSRIKPWQLPASDQTVVLAAGGMPVMPSHPGLFQHLGCCRKVPGVHNPAVTFWLVDMEVSNFF